MVHEFEEYRPYKTLSQFRREIGKYVDAKELARLEQYVFVPMNLNTASDEDIMSIPGMGSGCCTNSRSIAPTARSSNSAARSASTSMQRNSRDLESYVRWARGRQIEKVAVITGRCNDEQVVYLASTTAKVFEFQVGQFHAFTVISWHEVMSDQFAVSISSRFQWNCRTRRLPLADTSAQLQVFLI